MGERIRAHDWSETPLGPPDTWPQSLRSAVQICLNTPIVSAVHWGPELRILYNDAYAPALAERHPWALGQPFSDVWAEIWNVLGPQIGTVVTTGQGFSTGRQLLKMNRRDRIEDTWWVYSFAPLRDDAGAVAGIFVTALDLTEAHVAQEALRESEARYRTLFETIDEGFCVIQFVDGPHGPLSDYVHVEANSAYTANAGIPDIVGKRLREIVGDDEAGAWAETYGRVLVTGEPVRFERELLATGRHLELAAFRVEPPQLRQVAVLFKDVTERKRTEERLAASEARQRFLVALGDQLRDLADPGSITDTATALLGEHLGAARVGYADIQDGVAYVERDWTDGLAISIVGAHPLAQFGDAMAAEMSAGRTIRVDDIAKHPLTGKGVTEAFAALGTQAAITPTLVKNGQPVAVLFVHAAAPRRWSDEQVELVEEVAERTWAAVERARAEAASQASDARYQTLFESIESGFCVVEVRFDAPGSRIDYRVIEANPAFYQQTGFPAAILGAWLRSAAPELEEHWYETYGRVARTGEPERFEQGSDMLGRWFDVNAFRVGAPDERRVAILFNDISARKVADKHLRELNETLEQRVAERTAERDRVWKLSRDPLLIADVQGRWISASPAWSDILGWSQAELVGRTSAWMEHPDDRKKTREEVSHLATGGVTMRFENRFRTRDGEYRWFAWTAVQEGELLYATARDITEDKARQAELEAAQEALRQSQKMEAVGQLTGGLAHDFNNLLAGISGSLDMMQTRIQQGRIAELDKYMVGAQGAARRAAALTHRLLAFSRRQTLEPKPTDLNRLVVEMEDLIRRTVGPEILVESVAKAGLWSTLVDPNQLENALLNLCLNARDAMPDGGKITIETGNRWLDDRAAKERDLAPGQYISLCVSDNGTGMSKETAARAFDPFFTTKPIGVGTGLGLSMIYGFARQSGGQVRIYSEVGKGTMVCIYLPRHGEEAAIEPAASEQEDDATRAQTGQTVLVVDDEALIRMLIVDVLEELGYTTIEAGDGPQAMKVIHSKTRIDLIITDVGLPNGMNGRQIADAAREIRPDLKVLFVTGYAENAVLSHGHLDPGMQVITKPFEVSALARKIKELIAV